MRTHLPISELSIPHERDVFVRSLLRHLAGTLQDVVGLEQASGFVSVVGQRIGDELDGVYRRALRVERLDRDQLVGARVLVVDDNRDAAELLVECLASLGYLVRAAGDGPAALRLVDEFVPDIALVDLGMPFMDGYELCERLRALPRLRATRFIAVTGFSQDADRDASRRAGFDAHLTKPVTAEVVTDTLRSVLATAAGSRFDPE